MKASFYSLAIGDAIGFVTEGTGFPNTDVMVNGYFSDDTQLSILTTESLLKNGRFDPEKFSHLLVKKYKEGRIRGIGLSTKLAIESLMKGKRWYENFYEGRINYVETGANGCAMRILPIGIINDCFDEKGKHNLIEDTLKNSIITHGHPRAHISAIMLSLAYSYVFRNGKLEKLVEFIQDELPSFEKIERFFPDGWIDKWNTFIHDESKRYTFLNERTDYKTSYDKVSKEVKLMMSELWDEFMNLDHDRIFRKTGATQFRGSGTATVISAIFVFLRYSDDFEKCVVYCASNPAIDPDTIASMSGALYGLENGLTEDITHDSQYIKELNEVESAVNTVFEIITKA